MPFVITAQDLTPADQQSFGVEPRDSTYVDTWRWNNQAPPPINGQIRTDSHDWQAATHVYVSTTTDAGSNVGSLLNQIVVASTMSLVHATDSTRNVTWTVTAAPIVAQELRDSPATTMYLDYETLTDANRQALLAVGVNSVYDQVRCAWAFWRLSA